MMPEKQLYSTTVSQEASLAIMTDIRENEQSVQAFTQMPAVIACAGGTDQILYPHDLFSLYTAEIIKARRVFVR
jgi:hypothetical protein